MAGSRSRTVCVTLTWRTRSNILRWRWQPNRYVALKVNHSGFADKEASEHELNISRHLAKANPLHEGFPYVRTVLDSFEAESLNGMHTCLIFELMREPLWLFQNRLKNRKFTLPLLKLYVELLLKGLDYLHSECHIIHTGRCQATLNVNANVCSLDRWRSQIGQHLGRIRGFIRNRGFCPSTS